MKKKITVVVIDENFYCYNLSKDEDFYLESNQVTLLRYKHCDHFKNCNDFVNSKNDQSKRIDLLIFKQNSCWTFPFALSSLLSHNAHVVTIMDEASVKEKHSNIEFISGYLNFEYSHYIDFTLLESKILKLMNVKDHFTPKLLVYSEKKNHLIDTDNILYVKSIGDYVKIVTINGVIVVYSTIKSFYTRLPFFFFRQHRSYIVNIRKIKTVSISRLELLDKSIIPLTRGRKHQILRLISSLEEVC